RFGRPRIVGVRSARYPCRDGANVRAVEPRGDLGHAVGLGCTAGAGPPGAELRGQILGPQAHEPRNVRVDAGEALAVTFPAGRHTESGVALLDELAAARERVVAARVRGRRPLRLLPGVVGGDLLEIRLRQMREQALHDRVPAS